MTELPSIQQLKNFILYGKYGNFTSAANAANITQSAFSAQIKKLEDVVGVRLISRSNRGSQLTKAGELLFQRLEPILDELDRCLDEVRSMDGRALPLSIGIMLSLGDIHMNRHLAYFQQHYSGASFQQHYSGASFQVYNLEAQELLQKLRSDELDIISLFRLPSMDIDGYEQVCFCKENIVYYAPHIVVSGGVATADFIASQPLAQYSPQYVMNEYLNQFLSAHTSLPLQTQAWFSTPYAMMNYCQANRIGALLPERFLKALGVAGGWYDVDPPIVLPCYLLYKRSNPRYEAIQVFVDYMKRTYHVPS